MGDLSKIDTLLRVILLIQQDRAGNAGDLAQSLGVTKRTVHRYLDALRSIGVPCSYDDEAGRYRIIGDFFLPPIQLTPAEALALISLAQRVAGDEQIPLMRPAALAIEKVCSRVPQHILRELGDLSDRISIRLAAGSDADADQIFDIHAQVAQAIRDRRKLRCLYDRAGNEPDSEWFLLQPYQLWFEQRAWYVVGLHEARGEVRNLKLNRFVDIEPTHSPFAVPDEFSIDAHRGLAWRMMRSGVIFDVAVRFSPAVADTVSDTRWHVTQEIEYHDEGSITFRCRVDGLDEICHWILAYGPEAKVLQPDELAEKVETMARATAAKYMHR